MKVYIVFLSVFLCWGLSTSFAKSAKPVRVELANAYYEEFIGPYIIAKSIEKVWPLFALKIKTHNQDLRRFEIEDIKQSLIPVFARFSEEFGKDLVPVYADKFSDRELREMIAFHRTSAGRKMLDVQYRYMTSKKIGKAFRSIAGKTPEIEQMIMQIASDKGFRL